MILWVMDPNKISTLRQLQMAVIDKAAVVVPKCWPKKPISAAFMINMTGVTLVKLFNSGMYIYKKPNKGEMK